MLSTVVVMETTFPAASRTIRCEVPVGSSVLSAPAGTGASAGTPAAGGGPAVGPISAARWATKAGSTTYLSRSAYISRLASAKRYQACGSLTFREAMSVRSRIIINSIRPTPLDGGGGAQRMYTRNGPQTGLRLIGL